MIFLSIACVGSFKLLAMFWKLWTGDVLMPPEEPNVMLVWPKLLTKFVMGGPKLGLKTRLLWGSKVPIELCKLGLILDPGFRRRWAALLFAVAARGLPS